MLDPLMERVYETLAVGLIPEYRIPGVVYAYEEGDICLGYLADMREAYDRLCKRLCETDDDADVEAVICALLNIQRELCYRMYQYGAQFSTKTLSDFHLPK